MSFCKDYYTREWENYYHILYDFPILSLKVKWRHHLNGF